VQIPNDCRKNRPVFEDIYARLIALENMTIFIEKMQCFILIPDPNDPSRLIPAPNGWTSGQGRITAGGGSAVIRISS
jgi:hypothetical protein